MENKKNVPQHKPKLSPAGAVAVLPTLFTLGNCLCGFASIHYAALANPSANLIASPYAISGYLIFGAMICDMLDGRMARLAKATSDFGGELDSLADVVSFGVAPAFLALQLIGDLLQRSYATSGNIPISYDALGPIADSMLGKLFWIIGAIYVSCAALRLARFNIHNRHVEEAHMAFKGLPSPGAAGVVASSVIFFETLVSTHHYLPFNVPQNVRDIMMQVFPYLLPVVLLIMGLLMVSKFAYPHVINQYLRGRRPFNYVVRVVLLALVVIWQPQIAALLIIYAYAFSAPGQWCWRKMLRREEPALVQHETAADIQEDDDDD